MMLAAQRMRCGSKSRRWQIDAALPLDGFEEERTDVIVDRFAQRANIAERHDGETRCEWSEVGPILRFGGCAHDGCRAAVEVFAAHDDACPVVGNPFDAISPPAREFDRGFDR